MRTPIIPRSATRPSPLHRAVQALLAGLAAASLPAAAQIYNWSTGTYTPGVTGPATLLPAEVLNINAGGFKYFDTASGTFTAQGTVNWNADALYLQNGARIVVEGLWDAHGDQTLAFNGGAPSFLNTGTFRKSGGSGATTVQAGVGFVNRGTVEATSGRIDFLGGSRFEHGSVFAGSGDVRMASGTQAFAGTYQSAGSLLLAGGSFVGEAAVATGTTRWTGGFVTGSFAIAAGAEWQVGAGGFKYISGSGTQLVNDGTLRWSADAIYLQNGGQVLNRGSWLAESDQTLAWNGGAGVAVVNEGLLHKTGGSGSTTVQPGLGFVNRGTLRADSGALVFQGGATFESGSVYTGAGQVRMAGANGFVGTQLSGNLVLASGFHGGSAAELRGTTRLEGGYVQGGWTLAAGQTLLGADGGFKYLDGAGTVFTNRGTLAWNTSNPWYLQNGAELRNEALLVSGTDTAMLFNGGAQATVRNTASGTVRASAGQLTFGSGLFVSDGGLIEAAAGASVLFNAGATFNDGTRYGGDGAVRVTTHASFAGRQLSGSLRLEGGSFDGSAAVLDGTALFTGGSFTGSWAVAAGSTLRAGAGGFKYVSGSGTVFTNRGTVAWDTDNFWYLQNGARLLNEGVFRAGTSTAVLDNGGAPSVTLAASGRFEAAAGTTFTLNVATTSAGTWRAESGATIQLQGSSRFEDGTRFDGDGRVLSMGNHRFAGTLQSDSLVLHLGGFTGEDARLAGRTRFNGGTMAGTWTVAPGAELLLDVASSFRYLDGEATRLRNEGLLAFSNGGALYLQNGAGITNTATLQLIDGSAIFHNGGATTELRNEGLIVKDGGSGTATLGTGMLLRNLGTVDVRSGLLNLPSNWSNEGRLTGSGTLAVAGTLTSSGVIAPGASPGTLTLNGNLVLGAGAVFEAELESLTRHDLLLVNGPVTLAGTLALSCWAGCSFAVDDVITLIDSTGALNGSFSAITLDGFATGAFEPIYDTVATRFQLRVTEAVTAVPEPRTYALMLGGLLALGWLRRRRAVAR